MMIIKGLMDNWNGVIREASTYITQEISNEILDSVEREIRRKVRYPVHTIIEDEILDYVERETKKENT